MGLTRGNVIFDILEPPSFHKYSICCVFQAFFCFLHVFCNSTKSIANSSGVRGHNFEQNMLINSFYCFKITTFDFTLSKSGPAAWDWRPTFQNHQNYFHGSGRPLSWSYWLVTIQFPVIDQYQLLARQKQKLSFFGSYKPPFLYEASLSLHSPVFSSFEKKGFFKRQKRKITCASLVVDLAQELDQEECLGLTNGCQLYRHYSMHNCTSAMGFSYGSLIFPH